MTSLKLFFVSLGCCKGVEGFFTIRVFQGFVQFSKSFTSALDPAHLYEDLGLRV